MAEYSKSSKATSNDLWGHETASGGKSRALRLREEEEAKGVVKVKYAGQQKGQWMPRAIKKQERQVDGSLSKLQKQFNVEKSEAPAPAPTPVVKTEASSSTAAKGSTSSSWRIPHDKASTSTTSFNGAADLDELADDDKKPKIEESQAKRPKLEPVPARAPVDPNRDQVVDGAPRLAQHIRTSSKFVKVAGMAYALLEGKQVTEKNAGAFFEVLAAGMEDPHRLRDVTMRVAVRRLYSAAIAKKHFFPAECELTLRVWQLRVLTQIELFTDDSFQFTKAAKAVREAVEGLPCIYPALEPKHAPKHLPEQERAVWRDAIFDCGEACMLHHKYLWAKTTADMVVKAMVDRRQNFSEEQQRTLQEWNATVKGQFIMRQQAHQQRDIHAKREQSSYERKEAEWHESDITTAKGGDIQGGNVDNWLAKQSNN
jgi:hypothetical protein